MANRCAPINIDEYFINADPSEELFCQEVDLEKPPCILQGLRAWQNWINEASKVSFNDWNSRNLLRLFNWSDIAIIGSIQKENSAKASNIEDQLFTLLEQMTLDQKITLLKQVEVSVFGSSTGIECTLGVCGGEARIIRTRIPVWILEQARRLGASEADILDMYPTLRAEDLVHAWAYVKLHQEEIENAIKENEEA
jgi:uncharacterized protein (DUF433 family)